MADLTWCQPFAVTRITDLAEAAVMRARAATDGYLFLPGLLPAADILAVRQAVLRVLVAAGWCDGEGRVAHEAPRHRESVQDPEFMAVYDTIQRLEAFHRLALHPALHALYRTLFTEAPLAHPRNIARVMFPANNVHTTPAHQDHLHVGGTAETWTAWIPLGACPMALGGLAIMAGPHREPLLPAHPAPGAGGAAVDTADLSYPWVGGEMAAGDVLTFHSHTIHAGLPNLTGRRMRLSVDYRYQPRSLPIRTDSLEPHHGRLSWSDVYAGWRSGAGQYYWRDLDPQIVRQ
jgi:ectoine hydroxylase-related dioxygenase (phytanoyl-CoA dioxygenase family)